MLQSLNKCLLSAYYVSGTIVNTSFVTLENKTDKNLSLKELTLSREEKNKGKEKIKEKIVKYVVLDTDGINAGKGIVYFRMGLLFHIEESGKVSEKSHLSKDL